MKNPFKNPAPLTPTSDKVKNIALDDVSKSPERGTLVKKKNTQSGNPVIEDHKVRPHVKATSGARYGIKVKFQKAEAPEAGATQANGRLLPSAIKRSAPNFSAGMTDHN
jgi:hypothetical protein